MTFLTACTRWRGLPSFTGPVPTTLSTSPTCHCRLGSRCPQTGRERATCQVSVVLLPAPLRGPEDPPSHRADSLLLEAVDDLTHRASLRPGVTAV